MKNTFSNHKGAALHISNFINKHKWRTLFFVLTIALVAFLGRVIASNYNYIFSNSSNAYPGINNYPNFINEWSLSSLKVLNLSKYGVQSFDPIIYASSKTNTIIGVSQSRQGAKVYLADLTHSTLKPLIENIPLPTSPLVSIRDIISSDGQYLVWLSSSSFTEEYNRLNYTSLATVKSHSFPVTLGNDIHIIVSQGSAFWIDKTGHLLTRNLQTDQTKIVTPKQLYTKLPLISNGSIFYQNNNSAGYCSLDETNVQNFDVTTYPCSPGNIVSFISYKLFAASLHEDTHTVQVYYKDMSSRNSQWQQIATFKANASRVQINDHLVVWGGPDVINPNRPELFAYDIIKHRIILVSNIYLGADLDSNVFAFIKSSNNDFNGQLDLFEIDTNTI